MFLLSFRARNGARPQIPYLAAVFSGLRAAFEGTRGLAVLGLTAFAGRCGFVGLTEFSVGWDATSMLIGTGSAGVRGAGGALETLTAGATEGNGAPTSGAPEAALCRARSVAPERARAPAPSTPTTHDMAAMAHTDRLTRHSGNVGPCATRSDSLRAARSDGCTGATNAEELEGVWEGLVGVPLRMGARQARVHESGQPPPRASPRDRRRPL